MSESRRFRDPEQKRLQPEDCSEPILRMRKKFSEVKKKIKLEGFSDEELGYDGSSPSCSKTDDFNQPQKQVASGPVDPQKELNNRLLSALYKSRVDNDEVQRLLSEGADVNASCRDHKGDVYACHIAGLFDKGELFFMKIKDGLAHASEDWTPLHVAAYLTMPRTVRLLLAANANPNICDDRGRTPLDVTGLAKVVPILDNLCNFTEVIELLIEAGGQQNTMVDGYVTRVQTPLHTAVELENEEAVIMLLRHGASVECWNQDGKTPLHLCVRAKLEDILMVLSIKGPNVVDSDGETVLRTAITVGWLEGILVALVTGADVTLMANDGETPLHIMAQDVVGWYNTRDLLYDYKKPEKYLIYNVLNEFLNVAKKKNALDYLNAKGETALFYAVARGNYLIALKLLQEGASIRHTTNDNTNVFHIAADHGHSSVLELLLNFDTNATELMINSLTFSDGFGPIHYATAGNHISCVHILSSRDADMSLRTGINQRNWKIHYPEYSTPLHLAAANDNVDILRMIMQHFQIHGVGVRRNEFEDMTPPLKRYDGNGWLPIHSAINNSSVKAIKYLVLEHNESLVAPTRSTKPETALNLIVQYVTNPKEFLHDLLDSSISFSSSINVEISYEILMPDRSISNPDQILKEEMDVVEGLINSGNEFEQKKLLLHPLIASFIYLKWQTIRSHYFLFASLYTLFLVWLVAFEVSVFNDKDICKTMPGLFKSIAMGFVTYILAILIILQELMLNYEGSQYFRQWRSWLKLGSLVPVFIVAPAITVSASEWPRHIATLALFLVCIQMMNLLSQFPKWGYYVVMFKNVAFTVLKILGSFTILLFCFAFSFKIQFRSEFPFDGPWDAFVKTLFMLSAEFEYNDVFDSNNAQKLGSSYEVGRIIFLAFLLLAAIVLMNMMVGVAVDDITELTSQGHVGRLEKQAHFVRSLDRLNYNLWNSFLRCLPLNYQRRKFPSKIILAGDDLTQVSDDRYHIEEMPKRFRDAFYSIARENKAKEDSETSKSEQIYAEKYKSEFFDKTTQMIDRLSANVDLVLMNLRKVAAVRLGDI